METEIKRRCDSCGKWNEGRPRFCVHCQGWVDHRRRETEQKAEVQAQTAVEERRKFESRHPFVRFWIRVGQVAEVVYISVVSFIAWLIFWIGG